MRRFVKVMLLVVPLVVLVTLGVLYLLYRGTPSWYDPEALTAQQKAQAADAADRKAAEAYRWASQLRADEQKAIHNDTAPPEPVAPYTIEFTQTELNAFFQKWDNWYQWRRYYGGYVTDPVVILRDGRLILAGQMEQVGAVVSCHFEPRLDEDGNLRLDLERVQAGRLPMPGAMWDEYRGLLLEEITRALPDWRRNAAIAPNGEANPDAVKAGAASLLIQALNNQPAEPVLFLPTDGGDPIPVHLSDLSVAEGSLRLVVEPMSHAQRQELVQRLRAPELAATARD